MQPHRAIILVPTWSPNVNIQGPTISLVDTRHVVQFPGHNMPSVDGSIYDSWTSQQVYKK